MRRRALHVNKCIMTGSEAMGDRRYRYKAWHCMTPDERRHASQRYVYNTPGIPDSAFAYPIKKDGTPAGARRTLLWTYDHTKRRVAKYRAK